MDYQYYVQVIAGNYLQNVMDAPVDMEVHERFRCGLEEKQFQEGFAALLTLIRKLYFDISTEPGRFGMLLKEVAEINAKNTDYTNSGTSFLRVPNLLFLLGLRSELQSDFTLLIDSGTAASDAKVLKVTGMPLLLSVFENYGFRVAGLNKTMKAGEMISVSYPDNPALTVALKAMAGALLELNKGDIRKSKNYFYMMHYGLLEGEKVKEPKLTVESIYRALDHERGEIASSLHERVADITKQKIRMGGFMRNDWSCVYTGIKNKKVLMSLQVDQEKLSVKLNLLHIGEYISLVEELPMSIQEAIRINGWDCRYCNPGCSGGILFKMGNTEYNKCRCGSFVFEDLSKADVSSCLVLLNKEVTY